MRSLPQNIVVPFFGEAHEIPAGFNAIDPIRFVERLLRDKELLNKVSEGYEILAEKTAESGNHESAADYFQRADILKEAAELFNDQEMQMPVFTAKLIVKWITEYKGLTIHPSLMFKIDHLDDSYGAAIC